MLIDAILFMLAVAFTLPLVGGHFASSRGRSFWFGFWLCLCLPVVGYFILVLLPSKANPLEKELEEVRIQNKLLGINPTAPDQRTTPKKLKKKA